MQKRSFDLVLLSRVVVVVIIIQDFAQLLAVRGTRDLRIGAVIHKCLLVVIVVTVIEVEARSGDSGSIDVVVVEELTHAS
jgi:hypothetical protein